MVKAKVTRAGQMSIPAEVRRRWEAKTVSIEDRGDHIVVRPIPADPIAAFRGSLKGRVKVTSDQARALAREDERRAEEAKARRYYGRTTQR